LGGGVSKAGVSKHTRPLPPQSTHCGTEGDPWAAPPGACSPGTAARETALRNQPICRVNGEKSHRQIPASTDGAGRGLSKILGRRRLIPPSRIGLPASAGTDQPLTPIGHGRFGAVPGCQFGGVGLGGSAFLAPDDQPRVGGGSIAERHRWAGMDFTLT
jgi:hypothetical protein